jgi:hypothetical protein
MIQTVPKTICSKNHENVTWLSGKRSGNARSGSRRDGLKAQVGRKISFPTESSLFSLPFKLNRVTFSCFFTVYEKLIIKYIKKKRNDYFIYDLSFSKHNRKRYFI